MASSIKPIKIYGRDGPNPPKVAILLEELGIPYEIDPIGFDKVKSPEYVAVNPNGRIPSIYDPNTDLTLWESGAILLYLAEKYDTENKLSFPSGSKEAHLANQWLFYQVSGQGPYYGNAVFFSKYHHEKLPSAVERFTKEITRVTSVLEGHLAKQAKGADGPWLVGGKFSYADLSFTMWQLFAELSFSGKGFESKDYPHVKDWTNRLEARKSVQTVVNNSEQIKAMLASRQK